MRKFSIVFLFLPSLLYGLGASNNTAHLKDFAQSGDDVTVVLQHLIDSNRTVIIDEGVWFLSGEIKLKSNVTIKGINKYKSIIKRKEASHLSRGKMFYTEKANTDSYINKDTNDVFHPGMIAYTNICFEDLTFDFNRSPERFTDKQFSHNLYGIALIHASGSVIRRCRFIDNMNEQHHNGAPAVVVYQSSDVQIYNNICDHLTFIQVVFSNNASVYNNHCVQSVGTAIEFIAGSGHLCRNNRVDKVWWKVSCIGVNSTKCVVKGNTVHATEGNISCLTLGHEPVLFRADFTVAQKNVLISNGVRSIIIQNGCGIMVKNNTCSCVINKSAPEMTSGCVVASGRRDGIFDLEIIDNHLSSTGDGNRGCVTYRGMGHIVIKNNKIVSNRGVNILSIENCDVEISHNEIVSSEYSICSNSPSITIKKNLLYDGIQVNSRMIDIRNNHFRYTTHYSLLGEQWEVVNISNNLIINATDKSMPFFFHINCSNTDSSYNYSHLVVKRNTYNRDLVKQLLFISGDEEHYNM